MIKGVLERKVIVFLISFIILIAGSLSALSLPIRINPAVNAPYIQVQASVDNEIDIEKMEKEVALPLENFILNEPIVKNVYVTTNTKNVSIQVLARDSAKQQELDRLMQDIQQRLNVLSVDLDYTDVKQFKASDMELMVLAIVPEDITDEKTRKEIEDVIVPALNNVKDMKRVQHSLQSYEERYVFELKDEKVKSLQKASQIANEVQQSFSSPLLGTISYDGDDFRVKSAQEIKTYEDVVNYRLQDGTPLLDLVNVKVERQSDSNFNRTEGKPYYEIIPYIVDTASEVKVSKEVRTVLEDLHNNRLTQWDYYYIWDSSEFIGQAVKELIINIMIGATVAATVLLLVFRNIRTVLVIAFSIPICIMTTFISMKMFNFSINMISLMGLGLGTGMIVDACIVVLENIFRKIQAGYDRLQAVTEGTKEVIAPVVSSILTTVAVFLPIGLVEGMIGAMIKQLALTVTVSLLASLVVSMTVIPIASYSFIKQKEQSEKKEGRLLKAFEKTLVYALDRKIRTISIFVVALIASVMLLVAVVPKGFLPNVMPRFLQVQYEIDENVNFETSKQMLESVASKIKDIEGVSQLFYWTNEGRSHRASIFVHYLPVDEMTRSEDDVNAEVKKVIEENIPAQSLYLSSGVSDTSNQTLLSIKTTSIETMVQALPVVKEQLMAVDTVTGIETSMSEETKQWVIDFSQEQLSHYGLSRSEVEQYVALVLNGMKDIEIKINGQDRYANIQFSDAYREASDALYNIPIRDDIFISLDDVASLTTEQTQANRSRTDGEYETTITIYHDKEDKNTVVSSINAYLADYNNQEVDIGFAGREQDQAEGFQSLLTALVVSMASVFLILTIQFNKLRQPFIIFVSLAFTIIGVSIGFLVTGRTFDMMAMIGIIMLVGIVVNNAIVLIDFMNKHRDEFPTIREAVVEAAKVRVRPIFTTTLTTVGGLIPMLIGGSETSDFQTPIATAVVFGLLFSTFVSLLFVPMMYELFEKPRTRRAKRKRKQKEVEEEVVAV
ncbi:efflux RND transporter permease subunit [Bacillus sp. HMF5848]|uniref:efflux RND transporter permease subunit n=1 Tax=Bacillus sp. HMF5848 TaxID=2495421 RepID=UPI000F798055|nr:efflux RND transporter permease subunit [Bacillus sp. HMF5848]RSK28719.1 efflux RND transporter permease subunit [Bacillus sp. HMF5848]